MVEIVHFIKCSDGIERQIYPAKIKHKELIRHYTTKFNSAATIANLLAFDRNAVESRADKSEESLFDEAPYNAMMQILVLAFGEKFTVEEIEQFLDIEMVDEILDVFYGISGYKKKAATQTEPIGMNSLPQS